MLEEFLDNVIAKDICHQLQRIRHEFIKDNLFLLGGGRLEFLLNEARAVLIASKLGDMAHNILKLPKEHPSAPSPASKQKKKRLL